METKLSWYKKLSLDPPTLICASNPLICNNRSNAICFHIDTACPPLHFLTDSLLVD